MSLDPQMRILLVEDANVMRKMERKTLNSLGLENIIEAINGNDAIEKLEESDSVDLVISDWNMPEKSGYELLVWIRENEKYQEIPFLMATGRGEKKEVAKAKDAGVSSFIAKPFNAQELQEKIEEAMGLREIVQVSGDNYTCEYTDSGKLILDIAHIQITDHLVLGVLKHMIDTGQVQPEHFELHTTCMGGWNPVSKDLEHGNVGGACILAPIAMDLFAYGTPIQLILFAHKNGSIFVRNRKGGTYEEPFQDFFMDKTFYIPHMMSIHHMLAQMFFEGIGLNPGVPGDAGVNLNFEVVPPAKMPELIAGNPEAAGYLVAEPLGTKAIAAGNADLQFFSSELWENHPCCVVVLQKKIIQENEEAVSEFAKYLVQAGKFIEQKPGQAAEIAVNFLDPDRLLGLKVPILKNVLTEPKGITTGDLFPVKADLERIQKYMRDHIGLGSIIDLDEFMDMRFAYQACTDRVTSTLHSVIHDTDQIAMDILERGLVSGEDQATKSLLNQEGKYLFFMLGDHKFGIDILKISEIIRMVPIRQIPQAPFFIRGIINLRGAVVPVIDMRLLLQMGSIENEQKSHIVVIEVDNGHQVVQMGLVVDSVSEVKDIKAGDIEATPSAVVNINTKYILGIAKMDDEMIILLDIDYVLDKKETALIESMYQQDAEVENAEYV